MISFGMNAAANDMNAFSESMSRARDNGSGFLGQISSGLGNIAGRAVGLQYISTRSEEHTSELQSQSNLVCRLLLEKKKKYKPTRPTHHTVALLREPTTWN